MKRFPPWLTLFLLAPLLGELVSGHQSPALFFTDPAECCMSVLMLLVPYGFGALLCRELTRRWNKGWLCLVLLALAYGVYEEGIVVRSFFNPEWMELEAMGHYQWLGVNVTWSLAMVHFHILVSICASVFLAEIIHADRRDQPWIGAPGLTLNGIGLALWLPAGWMMTQYLPSTAWIIITAIGFFALIAAARLLPSSFPAPRATTAPHSILFLALGFLNMTAFFVIAFYLPEIWLAPLGLAAGALVLIDLVTLALLLRLSGNGGAWDDRHRLAWVSGGLLFFVGFGFFSDLEAFEGRICVNVFAILALLLIAAAVHRRRKQMVAPAPRPEAARAVAASRPRGTA